MNDGSGRGHHFREGDVCGVCHKPWPCCSDGWSHRGSQVCERCGISLVFLPPDEAATDAAAWPDVPEHVTDELLPMDVDPWDETPVTVPRGLLALLLNAAGKADEAELLGKCPSDPCPTCTALVEIHEAVYPNAD